MELLMKRSRSTGPAYAVAVLSRSFFFPSTTVGWCITITLYGLESKAFNPRFGQEGRSPGRREEFERLLLRGSKDPCQLAAEIGDLVTFKNAISNGLPDSDGVVNRIDAIDGHCVGAHLLPVSVESRRRNRWQIRLVFSGDCRIQKDRTEARCVLRLAGS
jgi:hypothetical protein